MYAIRSYYGFRGYELIESLEYTSTTNKDTTCNWCPVNCKRTFIDVRMPDGAGRAWSKVPLAEGWERVISGNSCPKGLLEDVNEMKVVKETLEAMREFLIGIKGPLTTPVGGGIRSLNVALRQELDLFRSG